MRFRASTATAICVIAAGLAVGGCQPSSTTASGGSATVPATDTGAGATAQAAGAAAGAGTNTGSGAGAGTGRGSSTGAGSAGGVKACQAANLSFSLGGNSTQAMQDVDMTNQGSTACRMDGFAGVDLVGVARSQQNYTWPLVRSSDKYSPVTLQPGQTAHFEVVYLPHHVDDGTNITVQKMVITPPNTFTQAELTWNQGVLLQDAATHPGTYITPIAAGA